MKQFTLQFLIFASLSTFIACGNNNDEDLQLAPDAAEDVTIDADTDIHVEECGDQTANGSEECDGNDLRNQTCESLDLGEGELSCTSSCTLNTGNCEEILSSECGNGRLEENELCDQNDLGGASCTDFGFAGGELTCNNLCAFDVTNCSGLSWCGDGEIQAPETCDDGNNQDDDGCASDCIEESCGDHIQQADEECDTDGLIFQVCENVEGQPVGVRECDHCILGELQCPELTCGNGNIEQGESCDDQNDDPDDGCDNCVSTTCGNGQLDDHELCDAEQVSENIACEDFGFVGDILCSENCTISLSSCHSPRCGNGFVENSEMCDDGNQISGDGCSSRCELEICGDAIWQPELDEMCDAQRGDQTCESLGYLSGELICDENCQWNTENCVPDETCTDEICDGIDNDCDNEIDEGLTRDWYRDQDGDSYGTSSDIRNACNPPEGYVVNAGDCDDSDNSIHPGALELCDGADNDCNDSTFDGEDEIDDCDGNDADLCKNGTFFCSEGLYCDEPGPGNVEICNEFDDDCDGEIDEDFDLDTDPNNCGFCGNICYFPNAISGCEAGCYLDFCEDGYFDLNGDHVDGCEHECIPSEEVCDELDNDCDGEVDENIGPVWYQDLDGDGYGTLNDTINACNPPSGYAISAGDCNDSNNLINPVAQEVCNEIDDDCNELIDEYFNFNTDPNNCGSCGIVCSFPNAIAKCDGGCFIDSCEDGWFDIDGNAPGCEYGCTPTGSETCDGLDNDCNGETDEGTGIGDTWFQDLDNDGFGSDVLIQACSRPAGYSANSLDCDDTNNLIHPDAEEICNNPIDNNCDGFVVCADSLCVDELFCVSCGDNNCVLPENSILCPEDCP